MGARDWILDIERCPQEDLMVMPVGRTYRAMDETRGQSVSEAHVLLG